MRKPYSLAVLTALTILTTASISKAQSSKANGFNANNRQNNTDFLGWQAGSALPGPLQIRNDLNQPITFHTNGFQRMSIFQSNLAPSLNFGGGVGIHRNSAIPIAIPGALLHIGNDNIGLTSTDIGRRGWRNWMEIGTFIMGNTDNIWLGLTLNV